MLVLSKIVFVAILSALNILIKCQISDLDLEEFIKNIEGKVQRLAGNAENYFENRCNSTCNASYRSCSKEMPELKNCLMEYKNENNCQQSTRGRMLNLEYSVVQLQSKNPNKPDETSKETKEMICSFANLTENFLEIKTSFPNTTWQYIGAYNGVHRTYPAREFCKKYDPRQRPWYISAATGSKNLVLILDVSSSTINIKKLKDIKDGAITIVDSLTIIDNIGIVTFSSKVKIYNETLKRVNVVEKNSTINYINNSLVEGDEKSNLTQAIHEAYSIINKTKVDNYGKSCENVIMLITDKIPSEGNEELTSMINELDKSNTIWIIFYFGDGDPEFFKPIYCAKRGIIYKYDPNSLNLSYYMFKSYYNFMTSITTRMTGTWNDFYGDADANGLGMETSYSIPIYNRKVNPPFLLAVYGVDVPKRFFDQFIQSGDIMEKLLASSSKCSSSNLDNCQLESLRNYKCESKNSICKDINFQQGTCPNDLIDNALVGTLATDLPIVCCKNKANIGAIVGGVVGGGVMLLVLLFYYIYYIRRPKPPVEVDVPSNPPIDENFETDNIKKNVNIKIAI